MGYLRRVRDRWIGRDERGFGLLELVIASTVMMAALTSMAYVVTGSFFDIGMAKERQTANSLLDETIEKLRALPYDTVSLGMRTADLAGDPRVLGSGTASNPYTLATTGHRIVHVSTNQTVAPLVPNVSSRTVNGTVYALRVYLTYFQDDPDSGAVTATAYAEWTSNLRARGPVFLRASTVIFSPAAATPGPAGSCLSTATHPFSGPCLEFFQGSANVAPAVIRLTGDGQLASLLAQVAVAFPAASSLMQKEQTSSVQGRTTGAGVTLNSSTAGYASANSKADNDPASAGSTTYDSVTAGPALSANLSGAASGSSLGLTVSGNAGETVSTTAATPANVCRDPAGTVLTDGLPCGRSKAHLGLLTSDLSLGTLGLASSALGNLSPLRIEGVSVTAHTNRDLVSSGGGVCTATSSTGCLRATATRTIDELRIGGLPNGESLLKLVDYTDSATAEAGIAASAPTASATGTLRVWNPGLLGGSYDTLAVDFGSAQTTTLSSVTFNSLAGLGVSLTVGGEIRTGSKSTSSTTGTCMTSLACRTRADATVGSPLSVNLFYRFSLGSTSLGFTVNVDLGSLTASASYADPPIPA